MALERLSGADNVVNYNFDSKLKVNSVWSKEEDQLLEVFLSENQVSTVGKERLIDTLPDRPFYIALVKGQPKQVIAHTSRDQSLLNLERGIASLLQLRLFQSAGQENELDVSGYCRVRYNVKSSTRVEKIKSDCALWDLRVSYHPEQALGVSQQSQEQVQYELSADGQLLRAISQETHRLSLAAKPDAGSLVRASLQLQHVAQGEPEVQQLQQPTLEAAIESLLEWYRVFELEADVDGVISELKEQTVRLGKISLIYLLISPSSLPAPRGIHGERKETKSQTRWSPAAGLGFRQAAPAGASGQAGTIRRIAGGARRTGCSFGGSTWSCANL